MSVLRYRVYPSGVPDAGGSQVKLTVPTQVALMSARSIITEVISITSARLMLGLQCSDSRCQTAFQSSRSPR